MCANMDSRAPPPGPAAPEAPRAEAARSSATQVLTPETERTSHFFWSYGHNFHLEDEALTRRLADRIATGFEEDRVMVEAQRQGGSRAGQGAHAASSRSTLGTDRARRLLERRIAEETA